MPTDRVIRILARLAAEDATDAAARLCVVCADVTAVDGAGIMLLADGRPQGSVCTSDAISTRIEELQYTLGEGPCIDAHRHDTPVAEPDLADPATLRWAAFTPAAVATGARAVFGFPLSVGAVRLGAMNLYRNQPGTLSTDQHADALVMADVAARALITMQSAAAPGSIAVELESSGNFRFVVHQASGMVAAQQGIPVEDALSLLRAHAFVAGRSVTEVARDVVDRRLRLTPRSDTGPGAPPA